MLGRWTPPSCPRRPPRRRRPFRACWRGPPVRSAAAARGTASPSATGAARRSSPCSAAAAGWCAATPCPIPRASGAGTRPRTASATRVMPGPAAATACARPSRPSAACPACGRSLREDSRVLDVGCGGGFFPYVLAWLGIRCEGIEPDRGHARFAREALRLEGVRVGALEELAPERRWTLITLHHVLEHLPDPAAALARLRALLPADGALLLEVPTLADRRRPWWRQFHRAHLCWWDERTLEALARRSGFRCESLVLEPLTGHLSALLRPAAPEPLAATRLGAHAAARLAALATAPAPAPGLRLRLGLRRLARRAGETALALLPLSRGRLCALLCRLRLGPRRGAAPS
ncbi:MAG: class I SAM-dependent methyltransferase [Xanthomonadales bacterium]|nr:class I SAM-dependent methyltransferase [Xanthomonadales bacterium]